MRFLTVHDGVAHLSAAKSSTRWSIYSVLWQQWMRNWIPSISLKAQQT